MRDQSQEAIGRRQFVERVTAAAAIGLAGSDPRIWRAVALVNARDAWAERVPPQPVFHMVVLGDSIAWGQGLREEQKFSSLVRDWLTTRLGGRKVVKWTFAHSGAVLGTDSGDDKSPLPPEVPVRYPSVIAQLEKATSYLWHHPPIDADHSAAVTPEEVAFVLVDGGINDVNVRDILTSDPTIPDHDAWIRGLARHRCVERMQDQLLPRLLAVFPNASVIVTGYYAIVSEQTRLGDLEAFLAELGLLGALGRDGVTEVVRRRLASQCAAFADETATGLAQIVPKAQPLQVIASASSSSANTGPRLSPPGALQGRAPTPSLPARAHFVDGRLAPEESFGAPQTKLWGLPASDPMASEREQECNALGTTVEHLICLEASAGHPNVGGARIYADRIIGRLECILGNGLDAAPSSTVSRGRVGCTIGAP